MAKKEFSLNTMRMHDNIKYSRLLGEYVGTLKGILLWEIPEELAVKIEAQIKTLENQS